MFLRFIKFKFFWKNGTFFSKKLLVSSPFKKEDRDYAFYMRDYAGVKKETPFYMTDFLFTEP